MSLAVIRRGGWGCRACSHANTGSHSSGGDVALRYLSNLPSFIHSLKPTSFLEIQFEYPEIHPWKRRILWVLVHLQGFASITALYSQRKFLSNGRPPSLPAAVGTVLSFLSPWVHLFCTFHINGIIYQVWPFVSEFFFSLSIMFSRLICVVTYIRISFLVCGWITFRCMDVTDLGYSAFWLL